MADSKTTTARRSTGARFVNFFPDNPLWMIPFDCLEAYDVFFTKERYAMRSLIPGVGVGIHHSSPRSVWM